MPKELVDEMMGITQLEHGEHVFHYTSVEALKGILDGEFWATEGHFLNDSAELFVGRKTIEEVLRIHMHDANKCERIVNQIIEEVDSLQSADPTKRIENGYFGEYIISFSLDSDSELIWSEFTGNKGYCIDFDLYELLSAFEGNGSDILHGKVVYNHEEQIELVERYISKGFLKAKEYDFLNTWDDFDYMSEEEIKQFCSVASVGVLLFDLFFKKRCFSEEHEYRIVFDCMHLLKQRNGCSVEASFREREGVLLPIIKKKLKSIESIRKIIIGPKNNIDIAKRGVQYFMRSKNIAVNVEKSEIPLRY